jgi:hypothetical protein
MSGHSSHSPTEIETTGHAAPRLPRSLVLATLGVMVGLLTLLIGFVVFGMGVGFCNATAAGTGAAAMFVGLWTALAARGLAIRRPVTFLGLGIAWTWLAGRIVFDFPATVISTVVVASLAAPISVPIGLAWFILLLTGASIWCYRAVGVLRQSRMEQRDGQGHRRLRTAIGLSVKLAMLISVTLCVPQLIWWGRGKTIENLARQYPPVEGGATQSVKWGACSIVFLGYELSRHGAEKARSEKQKSAIYDRTMMDALADLKSIAVAKAQYVRVGASGDHLFCSNDIQESLDDQYMEAVRATGIPLVLVDCQHSQALGKRLRWSEFCDFQRKRIEYYQHRYHPAVYIVACEPLTYHQTMLVSEATFSADAWASQLREMCQLVKSIDSHTRTGITVLVMAGKSPEWEVWSRLRESPELDILSVEIYSPENFRLTEELLARKHITGGHSAGNGDGTRMQPGCTWPTRSPNTRMPRLCWCGRLEPLYQAAITTTSSRDDYTSCGKRTLNCPPSVDSLRHWPLRGRLRLR